ncbi:3-sulfolactaldehyde reductase [subsurface metagenome]
MIFIIAAPSGHSQAAKLANNMASCANIVVLAEAYALAKNCGVDIDVLMEVMPKTSADSWQLYRTLIDKVLKNDFSPMFKLNLAHKDIKLIKEMATSLGVKAPGVDATLKWYDDGMACGLGEMDWGAIILTEFPELNQDK